MRAQDFNLSEEIRFDLSTGITTFKENRLVIFDANAIGLLRQNLINVLGEEKAREFFLKFGYQQGYSDFCQIKMAYTFDSPIDLLASGPVIHTWEGIVQATPTELRFDQATGEFYFTGTWQNSYEAEQHLCFNEQSTQPVCWSLMGYATGWCTAFFGSPLVAIEPMCVGKGDAHCSWKILPPADWGEEAAEYVAIYQTFWKGY